MRQGALIFTENREICPEMQALAKMAEMAINRQNRQTVNKRERQNRLFGPRAQHTSEKITVGDGADCM